MKNTTKNNQLLPDIEDYREALDDLVPVSVEGLEHMVVGIAAHSSLSKEEAEIVLREFFQVIRNFMLKNIRVTLIRLGSFYIGNPNRNYKKRVVARFKAAKGLSHKINKTR